MTQHGPNSSTTTLAPQVQPVQEVEDLARDLKQYVASNMKRSEILDFFRRDYWQYSWSIPTPARRLRYFGVRYIDNNFPVADVVNAVEIELDG